VILLLTTALAQSTPAYPPSEAGVASEAFVARPFLGRPLLELRGGVDTVAAGRSPVVCGELHPVRFLALDACGTGSGTWHRRPSDEMSHYRVEADLPLGSRGRLAGWLQPGVGFAEVQRGVDASGFSFGDGWTGPEGAEAAGAELSLSARGRAWVHERAYAVVEANVSTAWVPGAPEAVGTPGPVLPSASLTVGLGL